MLAALIAFAGAALAASGGAVWLALELGNVKASAADLRCSLGLLQRDTHQIELDAALAREELVQTKTRLERVIASNKAELDELSKEIEKCTDPAALRDRFAHLMAGKVIS